jgi:hypothetical protein
LGAAAKESDEAVNRVRAASRNIIRNRKKGACALNFIMVLS